MRFVFLSDTHGKEQRLQVPEGDVLVHAGDFCQRGLRREVEAFGLWLETLPHTHKIVVPGNHDRYCESNPIAARACLPPSIHYLIDQSVVIDDIRIWGTPWQPEFYDWAFQLPSDGLAEKWRLIPSDTEILVSHGPPHGILDFVPRSGLHVGCRRLAEELKRVRPVLHVFGHIHEGYGLLENPADGASRWSLNAAVCNLRGAAVNLPVVADINRDSAGDFEISWLSTGST